MSSWLPNNPYKRNECKQITKEQEILAKQRALAQQLHVPNLPSPTISASKDFSLKLQAQHLIKPQHGKQTFLGNAFKVSPNDARKYTPQQPSKKSLSPKSCATTINHKCAIRDSRTERNNGANINQSIADKALAATPLPPTTFKRPTRRTKVVGKLQSYESNSTKGKSPIGAGINNKVSLAMSVSNILSKSGATKKHLKAKSGVLREKDLNYKTKDAKTYPPIHLEMYWNNIRQWNFIEDWNKNNLRGNNSNKNEKNGKRIDSKGNNNKQIDKHGGNNSTGQHNIHLSNNDSNNMVSNTDGVASTRVRGYLESNNVDQVKSKMTRATLTDFKKKDYQSSHTELSQIPDTFVSYRQYQALWAPLCLSEARAQIMAEVSSDVPYWTSKNKGPIPVSVVPLKKDVGGHSNFVAVQIFPINKDDKGCNFMVNDIVLLAKDKIDIINASKGSLYPKGAKTNGSKDKHDSICKESQQPPPGILGHAECSRHSVDGLQLKVSRSMWPLVSQNAEKMYLLKLGANVTSFREFSALCRVDSIPLLKYLLCGKNGPKSVNKDDNASDKQSSSICLPPSDKKKRSVLDSALGKGFISYIKKKFNTSQLNAIACSAAEYGNGGFTCIKGPPGTGKTTTLVALLNSLHIRQFNKYFEKVRTIVAEENFLSTGKKMKELDNASKKKPRLLVCAPSNTAVDNIILKIMEGGFVDGNGQRYNPSIIRIGKGQSAAVKDVSLESNVAQLMSDSNDLPKLESTIAGLKMEISLIHKKILQLRHRIEAISKASSWPLPKEWEIRVDSNFEESRKVYFLNHKEKITSFECPPPPEPNVSHHPASSMPEYKAYVSQSVKLVERYNNLSSKIERCLLVKKVGENKVSGSRNHHIVESVRHQLEKDILDSTHIVLTTLGTSGSWVLEEAAKFEVVVVDEAAQSVEPATLVALQLGSSHAILVGDPQQLPATIFSVSGRCTKYDRSLFQRLEEAGHPIHLLNLQYRMHPAISAFPRRIFYEGVLQDGPNVKHKNYGNPLRSTILSNFPAIKPLTIFDLDSAEERVGTSLSNPFEASLALHLHRSLARETYHMSTKSCVAVITPYAQQAALLRRIFSQENNVEVHTVDSFQGKESDIIIFSAVRASGSRGVGFLSDVRRMNVALTRAKHFLFIIARCDSIIVNPYWKDLVNNAREANAVIRVPVTGRNHNNFIKLCNMKPVRPLTKKIPSISKKRKADSGLSKIDESDEVGEIR